MAKISVLGSGSWGMALALLLHNNGHEVLLWSARPEDARKLREKRENCSEKRRVRKKQIRSSVLKNWKICWKSMETMWIRKQLSACMCRTESRKE